MTTPKDSHFNLNKREDKEKVKKNTRSMKSLSSHAKLRFPKTTFAVCTLDANMISRETLESPRLQMQNASGRASVVSNSPTFKVKKLPIPAFDKVTGQRKETSPKLKQSKSLKMETLRESLAAQSYRNLSNKKDEFQAHMDELDSPVKVQRVISGGTEQLSSLGHHRSSSVRIVPLNPQIRLGEIKSNEEERVNVAFQQKFMKKYNHFRRTQNNAITHCLGRFKSIAEIKDRVSSIQMEPAVKNTFADWENEIAKACPTEREKAVLQKKVKQIVRLRRKILDGEIDFSKYYVEQENKRNMEKVADNYSSNQYSQIMGMQGQGPVVIKPPQSKNSQRGTMVTMRDSTLSRKSDSVKPEGYVRNLKSENTSRQTSKNPSLALYNTASSRGNQRNPYSEKVNPNRLRNRSNAPAKQVVNIHTEKLEKLKYKTQSLEVSLLAESREQRSPIEGDLLDSPDKSLAETNSIKPSSVVGKEEKIKLPNLKRDSVKNINSSNEEYLQVQAHSRRSSSKRNSLEDVDDLKLEGWPQNDRINTNEKK